MQKHVRCSHCQHPIEVASRAMSIVCPRCNKRVDLENYNIKSYHAVRELVTCGDVVVEKRGHVVAAVRAANLVIRGKVDGNVRILGRVEIERTGSLKGDIEAPTLRVENGAVLSGFVCVGRNSAKSTKSS